MNDVDFLTALDFLTFLERDGLTEQQKIDRAFLHAQRASDNPLCSKECKDIYEDALIEVFDSPAHADVVEIVRMADIYVLQQTPDNVRDAIYSANEQSTVDKWKRICQEYDKQEA